MPSRTITNPVLDAVKIIIDRSNNIDKILKKNGTLIDFNKKFKINTKKYNFNYLSL